jgi:hypothetical protein
MIALPSDWALQIQRAKGFVNRTSKAVYQDAVWFLLIQLDVERWYTSRLRSSDRSLLRDSPAKRALFPVTQTL